MKVKELIEILGMYFEPESLVMIRINGIQVNIYEVLTLIKPDNDEVCVIEGYTNE